MGFLVLVVAVVAFLFPVAFINIDTKSINYLLGVIMFGMGLMLNLNDFKVVFSQPKDVIIGCLAQFIVMPSLAWLLARAFQLDDAVAIGVVLVGCCPGGTASNVITFLAKGNLALSVGMTAVSTLIAPLLTPILTWALAGKHIQVDVLSMFLSILWVVILPIILGLIVKWLWKGVSEKAADFLPAISSLTIATIVAIVISHNVEKLHDAGFIIMLVVFLHNGCGLALGYIIGLILHLSSDKRKAISIEVGMQNSGLATSLAASHFAAYPLATIPGAIFSVWHNISGAIIARIYARSK